MPVAAKVNAENLKCSKNIKQTKRYLLKGRFEENVVFLFSALLTWQRDWPFHLRLTVTRGHLVLGVLHLKSGIVGVARLLASVLQGLSSPQHPVSSRLCALGAGG